MATYGFIALDPQGIEQRGEMEALDEREARALLRAQRVRVVHLQEGTLPEEGGLAVRLLEAIAPVLPGSWMPVRPKDLALLFRQVGLMLRAGHTLVHALDACARLTTKLRMRAIVRRLADELRGGRSLSDAMAGTGHPFSNLMVSLVGSGEVSGDLDAVLSRIADDIDRRTDLKRQLVAALTYPSIVLLSAIGVVTFLVGSVIPRFATFLQGRGKQVPAAAQLLLDITAWFSAWGPWLAAALVVAAGAVATVYALPQGRRAIDRGLLFVPVLAGTITAANMAQAAWTLAMLVKSGTTVLASLRVTARIVSNRAYAAAFEEAGERVLGGKSLSHGLKQVVIPHLMRHMAEVGESSGELDQVMEEVGLYYRKELDAKVKLMSAMIEPLLILFVGGIVGFVYFAFFQAVMTVSSR
jgi:type IV pilus assembly protein PilC